MSDLCVRQSYLFQVLIKSNEINGETGTGTAKFSVGYLRMMKEKVSP
jgi:hypothetical protein